MRYKKVDILVVDKVADRVMADRPTGQVDHQRTAFAAAGRTVMAAAGTADEIVADSRQEHQHRRMVALLALVGQLQLNSDTFHSRVLLLVAVRSFDYPAFVRTDRGTVLVPMGFGYCSS